MHRSFTIYFLTILLTVLLFCFSGLWAEEGVTGEQFSLSPGTFSRLKSNVVAVGDDMELILADRDMEELFTSLAFDYYAGVSEALSGLELSLKSFLKLRKDYIDLQVESLRKGPLLHMNGGVIKESFLDLDNWKALSLLKASPDEQAVHLITKGEAGALYLDSFHAIKAEGEVEGLLFIRRITEGSLREALHSLNSRGVKAISVSRTGELVALVDGSDDSVERHALITEDEYARQSSIVLTAEEKSWIESHPVIRVSSEPDYAPFDFYENGQAKGYSIDYLNLLAKRTGIKLHFVLDTRQKLLIRGMNKEIDLMQTIYKTPERSRHFIFTKSFKTITNGIYTREGVKGVHSVYDLTGLTIVLPKGDAIAEVLPNIVPDTKIILKGTYVGVLKTLELGEADATILPTVLVNYLIRQYTLSTIKPVAEAVVRFGSTYNKYYMAVRKDWPELHSIIQKAMDSVTPEELAALEARWLSLPDPQKWLTTSEDLKEKSVVLTDKEKKWLSEHKNPRLGVDPLWPPFEFFSSTRVYSGIASDYIAILNEKLGINMQPVMGLSWSGVMKKAKAGEIDLLPCLVKSPERSEFLLFTEPYLSYGMVIVTRNNAPFISGIKDFRPGKVALVKGYVTQEFLSKEYPDYDFHVVNTIDEGLSAVSAGKLDAYVGNLAAITYKTNEMMLENLKVAATMPYKFELAFGVRKDWPEMVTILNKQLASISEEEKAGINSFWINVRVERRTDWVKLWLWIGVVMIVATIIIAFVLYWNRRLAREIYARNRIEKELKDAKDTAEAATKAKSDFLATMSHEIRTPMNAIMGMTFLTLKTELTPKQNDYLHKIDSASKSLLNIINDILDFSKIEAGKFLMEHIDFRLDEVIENLSSIMNAKAGEKDIALIFDIAPEIPFFLKGDPLRLGQVLINLVGNAVKFTDKGQILVSINLLDKSTGRVHFGFSVKDTGIGMTEQQMTDLFQPFTQADTSTTRRFGGTGLGLTICKRIVEMMEGRIWVESEPDKGSTFSFTARFGVQSGDSLSHEGKKVSHKHFGDRDSLRDHFSGARVLLVEDNEVNRQLAIELLESVGIEVKIATNGREGVDAVEKSQYDLVLMDIQMPEMDGIEASKHIRNCNKEEGRKVPIIAMTAHAMSSDREKCFDAGMNGHISKPIDPDLLFVTLREWIEPTKRYKPVRSLEKESGDETKGQLPAELPGIDVDGGVNRIGGNHESYRKLLIKFGENQAGVIEKIKEALTSDNRKEARMMVHTLKGLSGNIGAGRLFAATAALEDEVKGERMEELGKKLDDVERAFNIVMESITLLEDSKEDTVEKEGIEKERREVDYEKRSICLKELSRLISENDADAEDYLEEMKEYLTGAEEEFYSQLRKELSLYNYKEALETLNKIDQKFS